MRIDFVGWLDMSLTPVRAFVLSDTGAIRQNTNELLLLNHPFFSFRLVSSSLLFFLQYLQP